MYSELPLYFSSSTPFEVERIRIFDLLIEWYMHKLVELYIDNLQYTHL